jgi:uncharacterized membrane protein
MDLFYAEVTEEKTELAQKLSYVHSFLITRFLKFMSYSHATPVLSLT